MILTFNTPEGASYSTLSPTLRPSSAEPSGEVGEATRTPSGFSSIDPMKNSWKSLSSSPS